MRGFSRTPLTQAQLRTYRRWMRVPYYRVSAFTKDPFGGNPAGVCPLEKWLPDELMQRIAAENNLSETAFFVRDGEKLRLRWMTPTVEVDLCGHATLATAAVLFFELGFKGERVEFETWSGLVSAVRRGDLVELDFPVWEVKRCAMPKGLVEGLGAAPKEVFCCARDYLAVFESEETVRKLAPEMEALMRVDREGIIVTAKSEQAASSPRRTSASLQEAREMKTQRQSSRHVDFVSRFFCPRMGVPEDPVTGSAHCSLIPFWAERLGRKEMVARQISKRGGELFCRLEGERAAIAGNAVVYQRGEILV